MARCAVPARDSGRNEPEETYVGGDSFRRLTLRSATGTAQRAIPTRKKARVAEKFHHPHPNSLSLEKSNAAMGHGEASETVADTAASKAAGSAGAAPSRRSRVRAGLGAGNCQERWR